VVCDGTQYYGYPKTAITNDYHGHDAPGVLFWWLSGFIFMKENNSKSTGILGIIFVRENNKNPPPSPHVLTDKPLPTSWKPSRVVLGSTLLMQAPSVKGNHTWKQQPTGTKGGGTRCMGKDSPYTCCACTASLPLFLSLHSCNLPPLFYKRDGKGPFHGV
jgi:hypothetical protein